MGSTSDVEGAQPSALDSADVMKQLTAGISRQNEVISEANFLAREELVENWRRTKKRRIGSPDFILPLKTCS